MGKSFLHFDCIDERVSRQTKNCMITALREEHSNEKPPERKNLDALTSKERTQSKLEDFVTANSVYYFEV